jgi:hypothetical protein
MIESLPYVIGSLVIIWVFGSWIFHKTQGQNNPITFLTYSFSPVAVFGFLVGFGYVSEGLPFSISGITVGSALMFNSLEDDNSIENTDLEALTIRADELKNDLSKIFPGFK